MTLKMKRSCPQRQHLQALIDGEDVGKEKEVLMMKKLLVGVCAALLLMSNLSYAGSDSSSSNSSSNSSSSSDSKKGGTGKDVRLKDMKANGETWQQGGLSSNQVSDSTAKVQKGMTQALAIMGLASNSMTLLASVTPYILMVPVVSAVTKLWSWIPTGTALTFGLNIDLMGAALDGLLLYDAINKEAVLSEPIPELEATTRMIGSAEDLETECEDSEDGETCNEVNATLDGTEVYISTLKNVGLEALEDVAGSVLKTAAELIGAGTVIQTGFGSEDENYSTSTSTTSSTIDWKNAITDYPDSPTITSGGSTTIKKVTHSEADLAKIRLRRQAHYQYTATAGVARADLGASVARSERSAFSRLSSYIGSGDGIVANIKVLSGLDLTLTQRLNLLNMVQGQQVSNDAAAALQYVEE